MIYKNYEIKLINGVCCIQKDKEIETIYPTEELTDNAIEIAKARVDYKESKK